MFRSETTSTDELSDGTSSGSIEEALARRGRGEPLPDDLRHELEQRFGADFGGVRLHTDAVAARAAAAAAARAFTVGEDIYFAAGEPSPTAPASRELLAHELTHVVQAQRGRLPASGDGLRFSHPRETLEDEARSAARRVAAGGDADLAGPVTRSVVYSTPGTSAIVGASSLAPWQTPASRAALSASTLFRQDKEPIVQAFGDIRLEQQPSEGIAKLFSGERLWALFHWEPRPGRRLGSDTIAFGRGTRTGLDRAIRTVEVTIKNNFAVDAVIDMGVEQAMADDSGAVIQVTDRFSFPGAISVQQLDGSRQARTAPTAFAHEYSPRSFGELAPAPVPPRELKPETRPKPPRPQSATPAFKDWKFKDQATYDEFAASHKDTNWAEVLTQDGKHAAFALTVEAITRMAERVRRKQYDFEFLAQHYPGGQVVGVHIDGKKLESVDALAELYFRTRDAALDGVDGMLPESEVYKMQGGRFGRRSLGHSQALVRWNEIKSPTRPVARDQIIVPVPVPIDEIETFPGRKFQALRVRGDAGMQTIYAESFTDPKRKAELDRDFKSFDPVADNVHQLPADFGQLTYPRIVSALKKLVDRKRDIAAGREPPDDLDAINERIAKLENKLAAQGVQMGESQMIDKLDAGKDLKEFDGRVLVDPPVMPTSPNFLGQRITARMELDYVPPGATVKVHWSFRPGRRDDDPRLPKPETNEEFAITSSDAQQIDLGAGFWNQLGVLPRIVESAKRIQIVARVSIDDDKQPRLTRASNWIEFGQAGIEPPAKLTITGKTVLIVDEEARYQVAEWTPLRGHHYFLWTEDGKIYPARESTDLMYSTSKAGKHRLGVRVFLALAAPSTPPIRESEAFEVEVQDPHTAGARALAQMENEKAPRLPDEIRSTETSIGEIENKVARGGGAQPYWEKRLEQQKQRLAKLNEMAPDGKRTKDLPDDPTALKDSDAYSGAISAVLVVGDAGGVQPLSIYVIARNDGGKWKVRLIDATSSDVWKFDGEGYTPLDAYTSAFQAWQNKNPYPRGGRLVHGFKPPGWKLGDGFETDAWDKTVKTWVDGIAIVIGALLLLVPEPTGLTKLLGGLILVATTVKAGVTIYENVQMGMDPLDSRNVFEGVSIVTSFLGVGGSALRSAGIQAVRPLTYRVGNYLVLSAIAADAGTLVYATGAAVGELRAIAANPTLSEGQKAHEILSTMLRLTAQGLIFFHANKDMLKGGLKKSDYFATDPEATAAAARKRPPGELPRLETGSRLDLTAELRKAGESPSRLTKGALPDHLLIERYYQLSWLNEMLTKGEVAQLLNRLETRALKGLSELPAARAKTLADGIGNDAIVNELAPQLKGSKLDAMARASGAARIAEHHKEHSGDGVVWAATDQSGKDAMQLLAALSGNATKGLRDVTGKEAKALLDVYSAATLEKAAPQLGGKRLAIEAEAAGPKTAKLMLDQTLAKGKFDKAKRHADNLDAQRAAMSGAKPLESGSTIIDSQAMIGVEKLKNGKDWGDLSEFERKMVNELRAQAGLTPLTGNPAVRDLESLIGRQDLRAGNVGLGEIGPGMGVRGMELSVKRTDKVYTDFLDELAKKPSLGGNDGAADRAVVADALFATSNGGTPTLMTGDWRIYTRLAEKFAKGRFTPRVVNGNKEALETAIQRTITDSSWPTPGLFEVSITDSAGVVRTLRIKPMFN